MARQCSLFALALCLFVVVIAFDRRRFPGPYCQTRVPEKCCSGRDDECTVPIHDTLCYCDQFCAQHSVEDCCPDYEDTCSFEPPNDVDNQCIHNGQPYQLGQTVKNDCNECSCVEDRDRNVQLWKCGNQACINDDTLVRRINGGGHGWTARTYGKFDGVALKDGPKYFLGTIEPKPEVVKLNPILISPEDDFDVAYFDSRERWPGYIHPAMDQGQCAASWAFSTAGVAADRWSIQSSGVFTDQMSVQSIISCNRLFDGCEGGRVEDAWYYLQRFGAAEEKCYPYTSGTTRNKGECRYMDELICPNNRPAHEHKTTPPYRIAANERHIMEEIQTQGPVQAIMTVYPDFYLYEGGVYRHSAEELKELNRDHSLSDTHSVKIIGWGEERLTGEKYWRCVNSWGTRWGEDGTFRIRRGENESGIEGFVIGVWPRVEQHELHEESHRRKKHRRH